MSQHNPNDPKLKSWVDVSPDSDFPIQNIPFGIMSRPGGAKVAATRIGDFAVDLNALQNEGLLDIDGLPGGVFATGSLNAFIALGKKVTSATRARISEILREDDPWSAHPKKDLYLHPVDQVQMHLPVEVGDYTDFYSSEDHARNVGTMFRDPENALLPNWKHIPVGYHGRASSIVVSGSPVKRPKGQILPKDSDTPVFDACKLLDFELEMAFVVGKNNELGTRVSTAEAEDHIFGLVLFNDWSARDIQKWEYVPLGPFLAKSFASTVSPWIVTLDALEPFRTGGPKQDPEPLDYLKYNGKKHFDLDLEVYLEVPDAKPHRIAQSNLKYLYWNMTQQLAHHTVNGCNLRVGDMCASGTISGPDKGSYGSMLELSWKGTNPIKLPGGSERKFLQDGDTVIMKGHGIRDGVRIGFGECRGKIFPAE